MIGTASLPGSRLSARYRFSDSEQEDSGTSIPPGHVPRSSHAPTYEAPVTEIHSASTELLTSASLREVRQLVESAFHQHDEIGKELSSATADKVEAEARFKSWSKGILLKKIFKEAFNNRKEVFEIRVARVDELEQQLKLSRISAHIEVEEEQANYYYRLKDEFAALCDCSAIWDIKTRQATDMFRERTNAQTKLSRERVRFALSTCELIEWDQKVPVICNAKGGELYLYPGFILYRAAREAFSLIEYHELKGIATAVGFVEEEEVPSDSVITGHTWAKCNKDGSRDKRFASNHQIPIARYGNVTLRTASGLWEEFQFSSPERMERFLEALNRFTASFASVHP